MKESPFFPDFFYLITNMNKTTFFLLVSLIWATACTDDASQTQPEDQAPAPEWVSLFDGQTLEGWTPKIRGYEFGDNHANTFRVADGVIQVGYENYEGEFDNRFGHLFYKAPFSSYRFRMNYRFTGEQAPGGPGWAWSNSGIMIHCQDPATMVVDQDFPFCIEVQLLGGREEGDRPTANLCTPGTNVVMGDSLHTDHCTESTSETYRGDRWVHVEVEVYADSLIRHMVEGDTVLTYYRPQAGGGAISPVDVSVIPADGTPVGSGWISLQSESHPVEFKDIEILEMR